MEENKNYYSLEEVADMLGVNYQLIYRLVRSGEIPAIQLGRVYRVQRADLMSYLESRKTGGAAKEMICDGCGVKYASKESFPGVCEECGAPLCVDCWTRQEKRKCAKCEKSS